MQLTYYLSIVLIMVSEFIPCMSCKLSYLACCIRFEAREHTNTESKGLLVRSTLVFCSLPM